jgi:hypothetical protein
MKPQYVLEISLVLKNAEVNHGKKERKKEKTVYCLVRAVHSSDTS